MADITILTGWQVLVVFEQARVVRQHNTVDMTAFTAADDCRVYVTQESVRCKSTGICVEMTLTAFSLSRDVINFLGWCDTGIMTGGTVTAHDVRIMHKSTGKGSKTVVDNVAGRTVEGGGYMPR